MTIGPGMKAKRNLAGTSRGYNMLKVIEKPSKWDNYFMNMAYFAASLSKDISTHIGAIVVDDEHLVVATGYNSFPSGINDSLMERQERPEKYFWFEHAERNAIYASARNGISLDGCTMYTMGIPCMDCARAVVQSGIKNVIVDLRWDSDERKKWREHSERSVVLFDEAGVNLFGFPLARPLQIIQSMQRGNPIRADIANTDNG